MGICHSSPEEPGVEVAGVPQQRVYLVVSGQGGFVAGDVPLRGRQGDPVVGLGVQEGKKKAQPSQFC